MTKAIGVDIVDIPRFQKIVDRWGERFTGKILTRNELDYCYKKINPAPSMAARFAAKEAMIKCISPEKSLPFVWHEMEVLNELNGRPVVHLSGRLQKEFAGMNILLSLSHSVNSAIAMIVLE